MICRHCAGWGRYNVPSTHTLHGKKCEPCNGSGNEPVVAQPDPSEDVVQAREAMRLIVADPAAAPTSLLLAFYVGLTVGRGLGQTGTVDGTQTDRDDALGVLAAEIDRRIPVPT